MNTTSTTHQDTTYSNIEQLLKQVDQQRQANQKLIEARGENFNLFSVLGVETKEEKTHSAMIAELLNPNGAHLMGDTFLQLFIEQVKLSTGAEIAFIPDKKVKTYKEKHAGKVDYKNVTGGRIDICLTDNEGYSISIENKIYAGEQEKQLERYINYNKGKNMVLFLTLDGDKSREEGKELKNKGDSTNVKKLTAGEHYHCISYKETILKWLQLCLKKSVSSPILVSNIRQYILLIQKLTNTMNKEELQLKQFILDNYESAEIIAKTVSNFIREIQNQLYDEVIKALKKEDKNKVKINYETIELGKDSGQPTIKIIFNKDTQINIEAHSVHYDFKLYICHIAEDKGATSNGLKMGETTSKWNRTKAQLFSADGEAVELKDHMNSNMKYIDFSNPSSLKHLLDKGERETIVKKIVKTTIQYLKNYNLIES